MDLPGALGIPTTGLQVPLESIHGAQRHPLATPLRPSYIHIYTCMHTCVYIYIHIRTCVYIYIQIFMFREIHTYINMYIYAYIPTTELPGAFGSPSGRGARPDAVGPGRAEDLGAEGTPAGLLVPGRAMRPHNSKS